MTNESHGNARRKALDEAALWLVNLQDENLDDESLERWARWMAASEIHAKAFDDVSALWELAAGLDPHAVTEVERSTVKSTVSPPTFRRGGHRSASLLRFAIAAAVVLSVAVATWIGNSPSPVPMSLASGIGEQRTFVLDDGSKVELDASTTLVVEYSKTQRNISLKQGRAYFRVAHASTRPFVVDAGKASATAVGTEFSVQRRSDGDVDVLVTNGTVRVAAPEGATTTKKLAAAGQRVTFSARSGTLASGSANSKDLTEWRSGVLVYESEPLQNVIDDLNRYSATPIILREPRLAAFPVTGRWQSEGTDSWLRELADALDLDITRTADTIELKARQPSQRRAP